jgi:indolepyruvate ferredoxin oxidoreductase beta subunit
MTDVIITGVGGQGNILAAHLLASAAIAEGYHVTIGETYGQSQRGGAVMSHVRLSKDVSPGPLIPAGKADLIVALEPMEALRVAATYANPKTRVIVNPRPNYPIMVLAGAESYPEVDALLQQLKGMVEEMRVVEGTELARSAGDSKAANVAMMGALAGSGWLPIPLETFTRILSEVVPQKVLAANQKAFQGGVEQMS